MEGSKAMHQKVPPPGKSARNLVKGFLAKCSFFPVRQSPDKMNSSKHIDFLDGEKTSLGQKIEKIDAWKHKRDENVRVGIVYWIMTTFLLSEVLKFVALFLILKEPGLGTIAIVIVESIGSLVADSLLFLSLKWIMSYY